MIKEKNNIEHIDNLDNNSFFYKVQQLFSQNIFTWSHMLYQKIYTRWHILRYASKSVPALLIAQMLNIRGT